MHLNKFLEKISRYLQTLISDKYKLDHKFQNKNQITNSNLILRLLKNKSFDRSRIYRRYWLWSW